LQEVILRCLEPQAERRYSSAAHLAFDLSHPMQVKVTERGHNTMGTGWGTHFKRWLRSAGMHYQPSPLPVTQIDSVPIVMVAVPLKSASDATLYALRRAAARSLGTRPGARLACVTVISSGETSTVDHDSSETSVQRRLLTQLHKWAQPLDVPNQQTSCHVLEAGDVAQALIDYASANQVSVIVMGAATHGLMLQRFVTTVPIKVAMAAPCTVILVKQSLPLGQLGEPLPPEIDNSPF
jgi:nucleotide-binding universal stress UspA family protein